MAPSSSTERRYRHRARTTASVGMMSAISALTVFNRVLVSPNRTARAASPVSSEARLLSPRMGDHVEGLRDGVRPFSVNAGQVAELAADDVDRHAGQEPGHHRMRHEPGVAAQPDETGCDHDDPGEHGEQEQRFRSLVGVEPRHRGPCGECRGFCRRDHHQLGLEVSPPASGPAKLA
jgi:hypothetical protein